MEYRPIQTSDRDSAGHPICEKPGLVSQQLAEGRWKLGPRSSRTGISVITSLIPLGSTVKSDGIDWRGVGGGGDRVTLACLARDFPHYH